MLFRDATGAPSALLDRCPHRNVPLSAGRMADGLLECGYHGWRFDGTGACRLVPALATEPDRKARRARCIRRRAGRFVWVYSTPDVTPIRQPYAFPKVDDRYATIRRSVTMPGPMRHALENALDVPHTAFLHGGLFRTAERKNEIEVRIHRHPDGAEPSSSASRGRRASSAVCCHRAAASSSTSTASSCRASPRSSTGSEREPSPQHLRDDAGHCERDARVGGDPAAAAHAEPVIAPIVTPIAMRILRQDASILRLQAKAIQRFGGEDFTSTEIDVLGPHIWKLLAAASSGDAPAPFDHRVTMRV